MHAEQQYIRRGRPRYEAYLDADIDSGLMRANATVLSLSTAGLFLATELYLSAGSRITVSFQIPDFNYVRLAGVVIYRATHHGRGGLGVRFLPTNGTVDGVISIRHCYGETLALC